MKNCQCMLIKVVYLHIILVLLQGKFRKVRNGPRGATTDKLISLQGMGDRSTMTLGGTG